MSQVLMHEARAISEQLSVTEKVQLIEWLSVQLQQELEAASYSPDNTVRNGNSHQSTHSSTKPADEVVPTWTEAEIEEMMKPNPKSGAEIAAMIESGEIDTSIGAEIDIPDVVAWLENLRHQERYDRGLEE